jgi:hypothetical protein
MDVSQKLRIQLQTWKINLLGSNWKPIPGWSIGCEQVENVGSFVSWMIYFTDNFPCHSLGQNRVEDFVEVVIQFS